MELLDIVDTGVPVAELLDGYVVQPHEAFADDKIARFALRKRIGYSLAGRLRGDSVPAPYLGGPITLSSVLALRELSRAPVAPDVMQAWTDHVADIANQTTSILTPEELEGVWVRPTWVDVGSQPRLVQDVLAAVDAAARRDVERMLPTAIAVLEHPAAETSEKLRGLMLAQAQLAAAKSGRFDQVFDLEKRHGPGAGARSYQRSFLLSWAQGQIRTPSRQLPE